MPRSEPPPIAVLRHAGVRTSLLRAGHRVWRLCFADGPRGGWWDEFRSYGPSDSRFDHHLLGVRPQRQIMYCADFPTTCVADAFKATRTIDRQLDSPRLVAFKVTRNVPLLDLTREGIAAMGAGSRARARRWSAAIHAAFPLVEGIAYPSLAHPGARAYALFERASAMTPEQPLFQRALADGALADRLAAMANQLDYFLV